MKRKVKFQAGGAVDEPSPRSQQLRAMMERRGREGKRVGLAERAREREAASQAARRQRAADIREVERMNPGQGAAEVERRAGRAVPETRPDFTTDERGTTRRGAATGREVVPSREQVPATRSMGPPAASAPSMQRAMTEVLTPRQMPLGSPRPRVGGNLAALGGSVAMGLAEPMVEYGRRNAERYAAEADARREANLQAFRSREQAEPSDGPAAGSMQNARPAPRPAAAPTRRSASASRGMSADRLNELAMGAEPMNAEEQLAQRRMQSRRRELEDSGSAFKKGGMVKKKAGGMIAAKPKKAAPKKPMPFKKGGAIKMKGKK